MQAGKHVLVDKPLCLNGEEGERMLASARAHPNQVMCLHPAPRENRESGLCARTQSASPPECTDPFAGTTIE